ncbi:sushi, von Willebrand factor type A, EGF and pentraxin domain-containing protein 1-like isoform X2 [Ornithodoros turicata]|uniref:sushi, von Willebrand factor type A, EGF and pentraxin domain-containing protein 1-like isoform X2 n=1 Tax=Ornithodoros turicata TaxID=34597 RepID=UPI0031393DD7
MTACDTFVQHMASTWILLISFLVLVAEARDFVGDRRHVRRSVARFHPEIWNVARDSATDDDLTDGDQDGDVREGCPQNREEAAALGRRCLRKCKADEDCISTKKKCLCDGLCGWSCVRPDLNCDELPKLANGNFHVSGNYFGARVYYECQESFWMSGPKERVCQGDGKWSGRPPECKRQPSCSAPLTVPHSRTNASDTLKDFVINSTVRYSCFPGYDARGFDIAKCIFYNNSAQWFGPDLKCEPKSCGPPGDIEHGHRIGSMTRFTSSVKYECEEGYELFGRAHRYCQSSGQWSGTLPECRPVQCPKPEDPLNGRALHSHVTFNSIVKFECHHGFRLKGPSTAKCNSQRRWEGPATHCVEIDCGHPGHLHNGYVEFRVSTLNAKASYHCFDGMKFVGDSNTSVCLESGNWSHPLPKCFAPCKIPVLEHAYVNLTTPESRLEHGRVLNVSCDTNYELAYNATSPQCNNGTWTHLPVCAPARCKNMPERPSNGIVIAPKTEHGMKALFRCVDGYELVGPNVTICQFGNWTHSKMPVCKEIYCPFPGSIEHGRVLLMGNMGMYDYRPYVRRVINNRQIVFECDRGYTVRGPPGATCVGGEWSPNELPLCVRGSHPHVRQIRSARRRHAGPPCRLEPGMLLDGDDVDGGSGSVAVPGAMAFVQCPDGQRSARCDRGRWQPPASCQPHTSMCRLREHAHGSYRDLATERPLDQEEPIAHGQMVELICEHGYQALGNPQLRCWQGRWSTDESPDCLPEPCELPAIAEGLYLGGYRAGLTISPGSSVEYACDEPVAQPVPPSPLRCAEGKLRPGPPKCITLADQDPSAVIRQTGPLEMASTPPILTTVTTPQIGGQRGCSAPERMHQTLVYPSAQATSWSDARDEAKATLEFPHGTEVVFRCVDGAGGERNTWKLLCESGNWLGRPEKCDEQRVRLPKEERRNKSCTFRNTELNLEAFQGDRRIDQDNVEFPAGTELVFRCKDIGKYSLIGSIRRRCVYGEWDGLRPSCFGLSQENDYALEKPPTILFRHQLGPVSQSNDGRLIVYPGTILHLECLWLRKYGTPKWEISHTSRKYVEGWTTEPNRDSQLEYRLSIYHAKKDDSGRFTCVTPMGHRHSVDIIVAAIHCEPIANVTGLSVSTINTKMGTEVVFSCDEGQRLRGTEQSTCLPSGNWSSVTPYCEVTECQSLTGPSDGLLVVDMKDNIVGSKAYFSCPQGYGLRGEPEVECLDTGQWSAAIPYCDEVICDALPAPEDGYIQGEVSKQYRGAELIQFACNPDYMMVGTGIVVCQENERWSAPVPQCLPACQYPSIKDGARISSRVSYFYQIGETVAFECPEGFELRGNPMIKCVDKGRWSAAVPRCQPSRKAH